MVYEEGSIEGKALMRLFGVDQLWQTYRTVRTSTYRPYEV